MTSNFPLVIPCIDIQNGEVVQLVQGRERVLVGPDPMAMLEMFAQFPEIQVIDLDAAMGVGENTQIIEMLASKATCRVGGGVRSPDHARRLIDLGAHRVIVGTAAFLPHFSEIVDAVTANNVLVALDSKQGSVVVNGWNTSLNVSAVDAMNLFTNMCGGFLCTFVDKEGMMQGTDLDWFTQLRATTTLPITAAGGITSLEDVRALLNLGIDAAIGMAVYTGLLSLSDLRAVMQQ